MKKFTVILTLSLWSMAFNAFGSQALVHRNSSSPTGWFWKTNQTLDQVKTLDFLKARVFDLEKP